jgi:hypothetical protein
MKQSKSFPTLKDSMMKEALMKLGDGGGGGAGRGGNH